MELTLINKNDIDFVVEALSDPEFYEMARGPEVKLVTHDSIEQEINSVPGAWWIMWEDGKRIGWVRFTPKNVWVAEFGQVIVDPEYRRKGIGSDVLRLILNSVGVVFKIIISTTTSKNVAAINHLTKMGFEPVEIRPITDSVKRVTFQKRRSQ